MAIAIFGGTFDPFHKAHKQIVRSLVKNKLFSRIFVLPAGVPPHKANQAIAFSSYRLAMSKLALIKFKTVIVSDYEIRKEGRSYTAETITYFKENVADNEDKIYFVMGSDSLMNIESWYEPEKIMREVILLVVVRPGGENETQLSIQKAKLEEIYDARIEFLPVEPMPISSTVIREQIKAGNTELLDVPKNVKDFISLHKLYADNPLEIFSVEEMQQLRAYERKLMDFMSEPRLIHSLNVMREAVRLARRFGENPWKAAVAGILHDVAKEQDFRAYPAVLARLDEETLENKSIIHGPVGASVVQAEFDLEDPAIRDAIYYHSTLSPVPTKLEKIIYLADKTESSRVYADLDEIRKLAHINLDQAVIATIDGTAKALQRNRKSLHADTIRARAYISKSLN